MKKPTALLFCLPLGLCGTLAAPSMAQNVSAPATLQYFESRWDTIEERTIDSFYAGYGGMWIPPTGRADSGNQSVGYDVFDRFDLGSAQNETLYGTEASLKALTHQAEKAGVAVYADLILNHNGFSDINRPGFQSQGDYPGFVLRTDDLIDGDFHSSFGSGDLEGRLAGLIDIDQSTNLQFIRHPVAAGNPQNIPAGTIWDQPDAGNARFYPDQGLGGQTVNNPDLFGNPTATLYDFNTDQPLAGDAVTDNGLGLMLRHARWMIQEVGIDGFRLDAVKHFEPFVLEFFDQAVHDAAPRKLDGSHNRVFSFGEALTGDQNVLQAYTQDIDRGLGSVGGNRDALDFPLFFAMRDNLTGNGLANDWRNIKEASFDGNDGFANDGSQGVAFVASHDDNGAFLSNVAHAYILMRPGNANVYFNAKEFGDGRDFPKDGRGDALGGQFGDTVTTLVDIRNTHGRGNYMDRTPAGDERETLIYERENSALVVLSNRLDSGFDARTVQTGFAPGTHLIELTGNAADSTIDPFNDFPEVVTVNPDGTVNLAVLRNVSPSGVQHNNGYLVYGVAAPQGQLALSNVDSVLAGGTATTLQENATVRLNDVDVIKADSFDFTLNTDAVNLLGNPALRDRHADGDAAFFKVNGGLDANENGAVDFVNDGVLYGFENFTDVNDPGFFNPSGDGQYSQTIDATQLEEGYHFLTARAFRHRNPGSFTDGDPSTAGDGGPAVFEDFKRVVYIDRLTPEAELADPVAFSANGHNLDFRARSTDDTAEEMFFFLNLDDDVTDAEVLGMLGGANTTTQIDRDLFQRGYFDVQAGNHKLTVVTREITGTTNVQQFVGIEIDNGNGLGIGDINKNNAFNRNDLTFNPLNPGGSSPNFETFLYTSQFSPAADANGDGTVNVYDLLALEDLLGAPGISADTVNAYNEVKDRRGNLDGSSGGGSGDVDSLDLLFMRDNRDTADDGTRFTLDLNPDGVIDGVDAELFVTGFLNEITGDLTRDGTIDLLDAEALVVALTNRSAYETQFDINALVTADINRDFVFNLSDIEPFLALYGDNAAAAGDILAAAIPEPTSAALMMGIAAALGNRRKR